MQRGTESVAWALFALNGRIARQSYILGLCFMLALLAVVVARILNVKGDEGATVFWGLAFIVLGTVWAWSCIALTVKRLHDLSLPGALVLILFVPSINVLFAIAMMALPSKRETNEHGPPPFGPVQP